MPRLTSLTTTAVPGLPDTHISLMPVTALVGPRGSGKSRILAAISWLLSGSPALSLSPLPPEIAVEGTLDASSRGKMVARTAISEPAGQLPRCLLLAAPERIADSDPAPAGRADLSPAEAMIAWIEERWRSGESGGVLLIEEPELDLNPLAQRYLYRVLRAYAERNQVIYSTRSASFVDAVHHMEIVRLDIGTSGLTVRRAPAELLTDDERLRLAAEFDHERGEMFFANSVVLVEGQTERQSLPVIFRSLGHDPDALGISITEVGGKGNLILAARLLDELNIPHMLVYDSDRGRPGAEENPVIARAVGSTPQIRLDPDFEGAAGIHSHDDKVLHAWARFAHMPPERIPAVFHQIVNTAVRLARRQPLQIER
jgi:hypothetical protein